MFRLKTITFLNKIADNLSKQLANMKEKYFNNANNNGQNIILDGVITV